jgi:hypothetical protein
MRLNNMRDVLLAVYAAGWSAAVGFALAKTGEVSIPLLCALGLGVGSIIAAFRVDSAGPSISRSRRPAEVPSDAADPTPEDAS